MLCSVDVAVIIFGSPRSYSFTSIRSAILFLSPVLLFAERKHGHPDKLFQYCSTDIDSLVQRQTRVRFLNLSTFLTSSPCVSLMESVIFVPPMTSPEGLTYPAWTTWAKTMMILMQTTRQLPPIYVMMA